MSRARDDRRRNNRKAFVDSIAAPVEAPQDARPAQHVLPGAARGGSPQS